MFCERENEIDSDDVTVSDGVTVSESVTVVLHTFVRMYVGDVV